MKKNRFAPVVRKVEFAYNEQVVASGLPIIGCQIFYAGYDGTPGTNCKIDHYIGNQK